MAESLPKLVLVTGGSGFVASHCILKCLAAGYRVRTTVRSLEREPAVRATLAAAAAAAGEEDGALNSDTLSFVAADLLSDDGWAAAVADCTYVLHVASPFPAAPPAHEDDLIVPARDGTLRVLRAAQAARVRRVVLTSSFAAVGYGHGAARDAAMPFTEADWTVPTGPLMTAYFKSKTLAERAAWRFVEESPEEQQQQQQGGGGYRLELATVNPGVILGPVLGRDHAASIELVRRLLNGDVPRCPRITTPVVDVRDVADLHLLAMTRREAAGQRYLAVAPPPLALLEISRMLRDHFGARASRCPTAELPDWMVRVLAWFDAGVALVLPDLGTRKLVSVDKANALGWSPRSNREAAIATGESLVKFGLVKV